MRFFDYEVTGEIADRINFFELNKAGLPIRDDGVRGNSHFGSVIWSRFHDHAIQRCSDYWAVAGNGVTVAQVRRLLELAPAGSIMIDNEDQLRPQYQWGELDDQGERRVYFFQIYDSEGLAIFRGFLQEIAEKKDASVAS